MVLLQLSLVFLVAAVIAVPLAKRFGLGSVLGYLLAGIVVGPWFLALTYDEHKILEFAEFGVVLLLFVIGLELQPTRLWAMRRSVFGTGGSQVLVTALAIFGIAMALDLSFEAALVTGLALSLSSTAFALQMLSERKELTTRHGRISFSILLFQDIAVIPIVALLPLLSPQLLNAGSQSGWIAVAEAVGVIALVIIVGHFALRYVLRLVARFGTDEVFTAMSLLTVIGVAALMEHVGLSMALGAFLAGVLLSESEYRHELEANIEPFKGLFLGLFFMAVGATVNVGLVLEAPWTILALAAGLLVLKFIILLAIGRANRQSWSANRSTALTLCQGGEFAFVILHLGVGSLLISSQTVDLLIVVVTVSMAATPLLFKLHDWLTGRLTKNVEPEYEREISEENQVIIAGFGRVGQVVGRILQARRIGFTALEKSADQVDFVRRFGNKVYYGDASRLELLRAAKADHAVVLVLAVGNVEASLEIARLVRKHFPGLEIHARARNRQHAYALMDLGVEHIMRETFFSSLEIGKEVLVDLGLSERESAETVESFRDHDVHRLFNQREMAGDLNRMAEDHRQWVKELEEMFDEDQKVVEAEQVRPRSD